MWDDHFDNRHFKTKNNNKKGYNYYFFFYVFNLYVQFF